MTASHPESLTPSQLRRSLGIALVLGLVLGFAALLGLLALRTPRGLRTPVTLGTGDRWRRIDSIANIADVQALSDGSVWALFTGGAIGRLDNDTWTQMPDPVSGEAILEPAPNSILVIGNGSTGYLSVDQGTSWGPIDLGADFTSSANALWPVVGSQTWIVSDKALAQYQKGHWATIRAPDGVTLLPSRGSLAAKDGSIWLLASRADQSAALTHYDPAVGRWQACDLPNFHPKFDVRLIEDAVGGVWSALAEGGVARCDPQSGLSTIYPLDALSRLVNASLPTDLTFDSAAADGQGRLWWAAAHGRGLLSYSGSAWHFYAPGSAEFPITQPEGTLITDRDGFVWMGGDMLARFKNGRWEAFNPVNDDPFNGQMQKVYSTYGRPLARDGTLWFAVSAAGVVHYDGATWTWFGPKNNALRMAETAKVHDSYLPLASRADGSVYVYQTFEHTVYRLSP